MQPEPWGGQQPDHKQPEAVIQDSVVSGNLHTGDVIHNNYPPEAVMMGNVSEHPSVLGHGGGMPGQFIMVQEPSGAAKVIGILVIISGCFGVIDGLTQIFSALSYSSMVIPLVLAFLSIANSAASVLGGYWMTNYQRRGVQLVLITVLVSFIAASATSLILDDIMMEELDNGNLTEEEYDATQGIMGIIGAAVIAVSAVCYGICGLIVAIPLMSANSGLDNSSLFSPSRI
jgi:hypothetical protein